MNKLYCFGCEKEFDVSDVLIEDTGNGKVWICTNCFKSEEITDEVDDEK